MNLLARLLWLLVTIPLRPRRGPLDEISLDFRCWFTDLDTNFHMNNGKYFSLMDLGRLDLIFSTGNLGRSLRRGLQPVVVEETMRFRRAIKLFQKFRVTTRVVGWKDHDVYLEQKFWVGDQVHAAAYIRGRMALRKGGSLTGDEVMKMFGYEGPPLRPTGYAKSWSELPRG